VRKESGLLDDVAHLEPQLRRVDAARVLTIDEHPPTVRFDQAVDHPQGRRLAAA